MQVIERFKWLEIEQHSRDLTVLEKKSLGTECTYQPWLALSWDLNNKKAITVDRTIAVLVDQNKVAHIMPISQAYKDRLLSTHDALIRRFGYGEWPTSEDVDHFSIT